MKMSEAAERQEILTVLESTPAKRLPLPLAYEDPAFIKCIEEAIDTPELIEQFDRLTGCRLRKMAIASPIERMVDQASGFQDDQMRQFVEFVHDGVYTRLPDAAINAFRLASELAPQPE